MPSILTDSGRVASLLDSSVTGALDGHNVLIEALIVQVSDAIERYLGRTLEDPTSAYTHYVDGDGTPTLRLRQGPLVSVTSVNSIEYVDGGGGARSETPTLIDPYTYVEEELRSEGFVGVAALRLLSGTWLPGRRNYKIVYAAGWDALDTGGDDDIPEAIVAQATKEVAARFNTRSLDGLASRTLGDGSIDISTIPQHSLDATRMRALASFRLPRVG